jgi:ATP-dependent exoDNAse (exonuclease V) beta subunit
VQSSLLRCGADDTHADAFDGLPDTLSPCPDTQAVQTKKLAGRTQAQVVAPLPRLPPQAANAGRERAALFIKRNPSALAEAASPEADPAATPEVAHRPLSGPTGPNAGQLYGLWWHGFIERIDWHGDAQSWDATFAQHLPESPDATLSQREWALLRAQLTADSPLAQLLLQPGVITQVEMPFLWAMSENECLEGIIDLAVFDPTAGRWLLLDWKTNRASPGELPRLSAHYLPQLSAYWKAVSEMLGAPVSAGLYATATGQWLPYESAALDEAWTALSRAPEVLAQVLQREETAPADSPAE